jgi:hypothetical protein
VGSQARPTGALDAREVLHLVWYAPDSVPRICRVPVFRAILDAMEQERSDGLDDADDKSPNKDPVEIEDRRDMFEILVRAASQDVDQIGDELLGAIRPDRKFVPPLLLLAGDLVLPFDEREVLKATIGVATPIAGNDEPLKAALKDGRDFLATPDLICPPIVVEGMTTRIREAFQKARRGVAPDYLELQTERALLERRAYQKRPVLGMTAIRGLLHSATSSAVKPAPVYLPEDLARQLPLFSRFRARIIAELYLQEDQYESHPGALKALALGRVAAAPEREKR